MSFKRIGVLADKVVREAIERAARERPAREFGSEPVRKAAPGPLMPTTIDGKGCGTPTAGEAAPGCLSLEPDEGNRRAKVNGKNRRTTAPEVEREVIKPGDTTDGNLWIWTSLSTAYAQRMLSAVPVGTGRRRASRPTESPTPALRRPVLIVVGGMDHATSRSNGHSASLAVNSRHSSSV